MEDNQIIDLYFARSEQAIQETDNKYGRYCYRISYNILENQEDAEECVSDTYMAAWKSIPPTRPKMFTAFLGKISRHISLDRWRKMSAGKRGGGETALALEELGECIADSNSPEKTLRTKEFRAAMNRFLSDLSATDRILFVSRYWYLRSAQYISEKTGLAEPAVRTRLFRIRAKLRRFLTEEDLL